MTRRVTARALPAAILVGGLLLTVLLALLVVTKGDLVERDGQATTYLVTGRAVVPRGLVQDDVVVVSGTATIEGTVEDDVVVLNGRARIDGTVHGDVLVLRGRARLGPDAVVGGDVRTSATPRVADGATVNGDIRSITVLEALREVPRVLWLGLWLVAGLTVLAIGLLLRSRTEVAARAVLGRPSRAAVLGGAAVVAAPVLIGLLMVSLLGAGIALVLGAALVVAGAIGAAACGVAAGRLVGLPAGPVAFLAGWGAIGLGLAVAVLLSPVLAALAATAVVALGIGGLVPGRESRPVDGPDEPEIVVTDEPDDDAEPMVLAAFPIGAGAASN